jgi:hypothetical protein
MICESLFSQRHFFRNADCVNPPAGTTELTTDDVCSQCAETVDLNAQATAVATLLLSSSTQYVSWWDVRKNAPPYENTVGVGSWELKVLCRYSCPVGYYSNDQTPAAYNEMPCLPCKRSCPLSPDPASSDNVAALYYDEPNGACGQRNGNIEPYVVHCQSCKAYWDRMLGAKNNLYLFQAQAGVANSAAACVARCNPALSRGMLNDEIFDGYAPISSGLRCITCAKSSQNLVCGGGCSDGFYNASNSSCAACNTSACPDSDASYRPLCYAHAAHHDAQCMPCLNGSLMNSEVFFAPESTSLRAAMAVPELLALARDTRGKTVRRLLTGAERATSTAYVMTVQSPHPEQCAVACVNNYAWVNLTSGLSPSGGRPVHDAPELMCLPCAALAALATGLSSDNAPVYAVWNAGEGLASDATPTLASMVGVDGGCRACNSSLRDVVASSTVLCELIAGYSNDALTWQSTFVTVSSPPADVLGLAPATTATRTDANGMTTTVTEPSPNVVSMSSRFTPHPPSFFASNQSSAGFFDVTALFRRRRLLSAAAASSTRVVIDNAPSVVPVGDAGASERTVLAVRMPFFLQGGYLACCDRLENADPETARRCRASALPMCDVFSEQQQRPSRRLLGQDANNPQACPVGSVKSLRGDIPCGVCPNGGSTTDMGTAHVGSCMCQPGWHAVDEQGTCAKCGNGTKRSALDAACVPCDRDKYTPGGDGAADCVCLPGTYLNPQLSLTQCVPCDHGSYCTGGVRTTCPLHSTSLAGSSSRAACVCEPAYYGDLSLSNSMCYPRPPGATAGGGCAANWTARYVALPSGDRFVQCTSPCRAGTYALLAPATQLLIACVPCDADTYAVEGAQAVDGCTSCPVGRGTRGRIGATTPDDCACVVGVSNTSTSCDGCAANHYYDLLTKRCLACAAGQGSPPNTVGFYGCQCLPGTYATGATCSPCPLGTYSRAIGLVCSQCPAGCTTDAVGSTTVAACRCARTL